MLLRAGVLTAAVGGAVIAAVTAAVMVPISVVFTSWLFPTYLIDLQAAYVETLRGAGKTEADIANAMAGYASALTSRDHAFQAFSGNFAVGVITAGIGAMVMGHQVAGPARR